MCISETGEGYKKCFPFYIWWTFLRFNQKIEKWFLHVKKHKTFIFMSSNLISKSHVRLLIHWRLKLKIHWTKRHVVWIKACFIQNMSFCQSKQESITNFDNCLALSKILKVSPFYLKLVKQVVSRNKYVQNNIIPYAKSWCS